MRHAGTLATLSMLLVTAAAAVAFGRTAAAQEIEGIYLREKGSLAMLNLRYVPQLLFDNGEVYTDIAIPPEDLNIAASKQAEPERWGRWWKQGDDVYFDLPDGEKKVELYKNPAVPASENLQLEGVWSYQFASVSVDLASSVGIERDIGFSGNGVFATGSFSGGSGSGATGYSESGLIPQGTYRISGYSVEFQRRNGGVERKLFFFYPDDQGGPDYGTINVGASHYQRESESFRVEPPSGPGSAAATATREVRQGNYNSSIKDGLRIDPGVWVFETYSADGDLEESDAYCLSKPMFHPLQIMVDGDFQWTACKEQADIDGQRGSFVLACDAIYEGDDLHIGLRFDLAVDGGEGAGEVMVMPLVDGGYAKTEPKPLKMRRDGGC